MSDPRPVTDWENEEVHGKALSCRKLFEMDLAKVQALREREAAWQASLPKEAEEACKAALKEICSQDNDWGEPFKEAVYLSFALRPMIMHLRLDDHGPDRDALLWIVDRIQHRLEGEQARMDRVMDILGAPGHAKHGNTFTA